MDNCFFSIRYSEYFFFNINKANPDPFWLNIRTSSFVSLVVALMFESCSAIMSFILLIFNDKKAINIVSFSISMGLIALIGIIVFCAGI